MGENQMVEKAQTEKCFEEFGQQSCPNEMLAFSKIDTDGCVVLEDSVFTFGDLYFQDEQHD